MDFMIQKSELLRELQYVQGGVERKSTVPILSNLLLETTGNTLVVTATDLDVTVQCVCPASVKGSGSAAVSARKLFDIARFLPDAEIHFKSDGQNWIHLTCERSKFKIASLPKDNFPALPSVEGRRLLLPPQPLSHMSSRCAFAITQEESRYTLSGALMILNPTGITLVSTDGHRLVYISHNVEIAGLDQEERILIPKKTLTELTKLTGEQTVAVEFGSSENHLLFQLGDRLLISRRLAGQFPNFNMVIPRENDKKALLNTVELTNALKRVSVMADDESHSVRLSVKKDQLDIHSSGAEIGEAKETVSAKYDAEPLEIGFNAQYLLDFLSGLDSDEVEINLRDGETQGLLKPVAEEGYDHQYVLMPMKL